MTVCVKMPKKNSERFKTDVMSRCFQSDDATLTRYGKDDEQFGYFTFDSEYDTDIDTVMQMLPDGSIVL